MDKIADKGYTIITKDNCVYCKYSCKLLDDNGFKYIKIDNNELIEKEIESIKPDYHKTYPMIFKDKQFIGGYMELRKYLRII